MRKVLSILAAIAAAGIGTPAIASDIIWLDSDHSPFSGDYANGASLVFTGGGVNVRASAWSIHDDGKIYQAQLGVWSGGLGVKNGSGDNSHTIDNQGFLDFIVLQFDNVVKLENARFDTGWHNLYDSDATLGYTTTNLSFAAPPALQGLSQAQLAGLNLYSSNYATNTDNTRNVNLTGNAGNLWLIGASFNNPEGNYKFDGFKLEKLTFALAPPPAVPEPATWAMMLIGFGAVGGAMRARRKRDLTAAIA